MTFLLLTPQPSPDVHKSLVMLIYNKDFMFYLSVLSGDLSKNTHCGPNFLRAPLKSRLFSAKSIYQFAINGQFLKCHNISVSD